MDKVWRFAATIAGQRALGAGRFGVPHLQDKILNFILSRVQNKLFFFQEFTS